MIGIVGLPVFSGLKGGVGVLLGPTGGFLLSFPLASYFISKLRSKSFLRNLLLNLLLGLIFIYFIGTLHMALVNVIKYFDTLKMMLAFIPIDILKIFIGTIVGRKINKTLAKT